MSQRSKKIEAKKIEAKKIEAKKIEAKKSISPVNPKETKEEGKDSKGDSKGLSHLSRLSRLSRAERREADSREKSPSYGAVERCQAVLSLWTERRRPAEVCRELGIPYMMLSHWENRALEGMLQALEPRVRMDRGPALSPRLQAMLEKRSSVIGTKKAAGRLAERLARIQGLPRAESRGKKESPHPEHPKSP